MNTALLRKALELQAALWDAEAKDAERTARTRSDEAERLASLPRQDGETADQARAFANQIATERTEASYFQAVYSECMAHARALRELADVIEQEDDDR